MTKSTTRRFLCCLLALCCLLGSLTAFSLAAGTSYPYSASVNADTNLRRSPSSAESNIIARIPKGTILTVTGASGNFLCVTYDGQVGYIFKQYAEQVTTNTSESGSVAYGFPYYTTTKSSVNLRTTRSTTSARVTTIPKGTTVIIHGVSGDWAQVTYQEKTGYCMTAYLKLLTVVEPTAAPTAVPTSAPILEDSTYKVLQNGSTGNQVLALQQALAELGYLTSTPDGTYSTTTTQAVIALQKMNGLPMNGIADANLQALIFHGQPKNSSGTKVSIKTLPALSGITIRLHDQGVLVSTVQTRLTQLGYYDGEISGVYDVATQTAVKAFQKANGLKADGACGTATQEKLMSAAAAPGTLPTMEVTVTATPAPTDLPPLTTPAATVRKGSTGNDARLVQQRLIDLGYLSGVADSIFGTASVNALKEFQAKNGLSADGIAGASTYQVLFSYLAISADYIVTPAPTATPLATATPTPAPITKDNVVTIHQGTSGDAVLRLQERLTALGYYNSRRDGVCMADDAAAIRAFQRMNGLSVDGVAGYDTQVLLYSATAIGSDGIMAGASVDVSVTLRRGMTGETVRALQQRLITLGYLSGTADGIYGTATAEAVYNFQKRNGLTRDGVAGNKTLIALYSASAATPTPAPTIAPVNTPSAASVIASASALHRGDNGTAVKAMQQRLIDLGYLTSGSADGIFGVKTYQALRDFQLANALYVDGVAGKNTIASLNSSSATGKNTARPNTTATPTPNISNDIGTTTKVSAENVVYEYWYSTVRSACRQYPYATVYDYSTGISWQVHMFSYGKHAEAEPLTAADTAKLEQAFGGNTWTPKAVWVIFADGTVRMATTHSMPHEVQHITDNNFPGHLCIHFPRTQAQVTAIGPYAMSHQQTVEKGWAETQAMIAN